MNDTMVIIVTAIVGVGGLVGVAYLLDRKRAKSGPIGPTLPAIGPVGIALLWVARVLVVLMVLSIVGAFALQSITLAWFTAFCLVLYIVAGTIYRIVRISGK
jgi:hypothetical protein